MSHAEFIDAITAELLETCPNSLRIEEAFSLGVRLGRYLEKNDLDDVVLSCFDARHAIEKLREEEGALLEDIYKCTRIILRGAIDEQVAINGRWEVGCTRFERLGLFDDAVVDNHKIQLKNVEQHDSGGDIDAEFELIGDLATVFERHKFPPLLMTSFSCYDEESVVLHSGADVSKYQKVKIDTPPVPNEEYLNQLSSLRDDLSKMYLMQMLAE